MQILNQSVTCPWCNSYYAIRPLETNCANCGGPLPKSSGSGRGEKPESAPRILPKKFIWQVLYWRNTFSFIGIIFMIVGIPTLLAMGMGVLFLVIGFFMFRHGHKQGKEKINALENGIAAEGKIMDISKDYSQSINGQHPYIISYTFDTKSGSEQIDKVTCWDDNNQFRYVDEEIWVVYIPENPTISSPWPPIV